MMIYQTIDPALEAILGHRSAHSLATGPVIADPFIYLVLSAQFINDVVCVHTTCDFYFSSYLSTSSSLTHLLYKIFI
jgi:hypothetical protein